METVYFVAVVIGFVVVIVTMLITSHLERVESAKKDISISKLLRLVDPNAIVAVEQPVVIEEKEAESDLVDISDMPSLSTDRQE